LVRLADHREHAVTGPKQAFSGLDQARAAGIWHAANACGIPARRAKDRLLERAIGMQIRNRRRQAQLSIFELATAASISAGMLSKVENGRISPSLATLRAVAEALNVPIATLFGVLEA
jgi:DNA-binding XRE family transcriptional regulator